MSRIGKKPVVIENKVKASMEGMLIKVEGPLGKFSRHVDDSIEVKIDEKMINVTRKDDSRKSRSLHGLTRTLIQNMVTGVSTGFTRELEFNGVGYRVAVSGKTVLFNLGYSHPIMFELPDGITCKVEKNKIVLHGADKQLLGTVAADMRAFRKPEPYKGKGVKYAEEHIRRKEGKKMVS